MITKIKLNLGATLLSLCLFGTLCELSAKDTSPGKAEKSPQKVAPLKLVLPPVHYAVPGVELEIIFSHAVLIKSPENLSFVSKCDVGISSDDRLVLNPTKDDIGDHRLTVTLNDSNGDALASATTVIKVVSPKAGAGEAISLLVMGDSLTNASHYPNEIAKLLSGSGNPKWKMLGTYHPASAKENVFHEGYGGWTWKRFNSNWAPEANQIGNTRSSPFLYLNADQKPTLDIGRYLVENCEGKAPDYLTILLGINDCFHPNPDDPKAVADRISLMISEAEIFLTAFRKESPDTEIGICLVPAANSRDGAFDANYKGKYTRWGWRRIQYRLVERQIEHFGNRESENLFLIPTSLVVDSTIGYPAENGVHPNEFGYKQLAGSIYAWLKWRMSE